MADQEENVDKQEETAEAADEAKETAATEEAPVEEAAEAVAEAAEEAGEEAAAVAEAGEEVAEAAAEAGEEAAEAAPETEAAAPSADADEELTWEVLHKKTVADLRDIAQGIEHEALQGYSTMHKEQLVPALCTALGIEAHAHHEVVGINKDRVKGKIKELKVARQAAVEAGDHAQLKLVRKRIKSLKRKIRRATV